jgi:hypothetical protein
LVSDWGRWRRKSLKKTVDLHVGSFSHALPFVWVEG